MKMKQVCEQTGLTERTVRLYVDRGLSSPKTHWSNGREYTDFSPTDVRALQNAAVLRRAGFPIEAVRQMIEDPSCIPSLLEKYRAALAEDTLRRQALLAAVEQMDSERIRSVEMLASELERASRALPLPGADVQLNFGRMDRGLVSEEEKQQAVREYEQRQLRQLQVGRWIVYGIAAGNVIGSFLTQFFVQGVSFFSIAGFVIDVVLSLALCWGVRWVRWLFVATSLYAVLTGLAALFFVPGMSGAGAVPVWMWLALGLRVVWSGASAGLLIWNKGVREFLYQQKNH